MTAFLAIYLGMAHEGSVLVVLSFAVSVVSFMLAEFKGVTLTWFVGELFFRAVGVKTLLATAHEEYVSLGVETRP